MPLRPLEGMRVVDVTTSIAGPYCAEILAALGADVVKVERPDTGDDGRAWGPPFWNGESAMFLAVNAGKRSLAVSLSDERGRDAVLRLVDRADVFLQSLRPGLAERLGLGAETLRERNARLVYCSIGAYGRVGPLSEEPGYDALMQAAGGLISMTGEPDRPGVRVGSSLIDMGTGMWAALGILSALLERERTGQGAVVDTSLYETALGYIGYHLVGYLADGTVPTGQGTTFPMVAPYQVFPTRDGELMVAGGNDRLFAALCDVLALPELVTDERFRTNPDRVRHRDELVALVSARLREHRERGLAGALDGCGRAGRTRRRRRRRRDCRADTCARDAPAGRPRGDPGAPAPGASALLRPRARNARIRPARRRRAHRGDPRGGRLLARRDRRARARRRHSYAIASSGSSFAARRAGKIAATIPTTIAAITKTITCVVGNENSMKSTRAMSSAASTIPSTIPSVAPISAVIMLSCRIIRRTCTARHADRAQHPDLARALEHRQDERVHDPEQAHDDRQREQHVEDVQDRS